MADLNISIGFNVEQNGLIDQYIQKINAGFNQVFNNGGKGSKLAQDLFGDSLTKVQQLKTMVDGITNHPGGVTGGFNAALAQAGGSIDALKANFTQAGSIGATLFANILSQIFLSNLQLTQSNKLLNSMFTTMKNTVKWGLSSMLFKAITGEIGKAYNYVKNLDSALNDIRIVTGQTADQMDKFAISAQKAAKAMGSDTLSYVKGALLYYQQGIRSADELAARTQTTTKVSNVTNLSTSEATSALTAVWNGYQVATQDTEKTVDKLAAVAANSAVDLEYLTTAMSKTAAAANTMGLPIDQLNAMIATTGAVTQLSAESVGTAYKTIIARLGDLKIAGAEDEFGVTLGLISKLLAGAGILILDVNGDLRDTGDVITEIGDKWQTWSKAQKDAVAIAMAGKRQYTQLFALFENWDQYTKLMDISANSQGALLKLQDTYMESTAAHLKSLGAEAEKTYSLFMLPDMMNPLIDGLNDALTLFNKFLGGFKSGWNVIIDLVSTLGLVFSNQIGNALGDYIAKLEIIKQNQQLLNAYTTAAGAGFVSNNIDGLGTNIYKDTDGKVTGYTANGVLLDEERAQKYVGVLQQILSVAKQLTTEEFNTLRQQEALKIALEQLLADKQALIDSANGAGEGELNAKAAALEKVAASEDKVAVKAQEYNLILQDEASKTEEVEDATLDFANILEEQSSKLAEGEEGYNEINTALSEFYLNGEISKESAEAAANALARHATLAQEDAAAARELATAVHEGTSSLEEEEGKLDRSTGALIKNAQARKSSSEGTRAAMFLVKGLNVASNVLKTFADESSSAQLKAESLAGSLSGIGGMIGMIWGPIGSMIGSAAGSMLTTILNATGLTDKLADALMNSSEKAEQVTEKVNQAYEANKKYNQSSGELNNITNEWNQLTANLGTYGEGLENLSNEEQARYHELVDIITSYNEDAVIGWDALGNAIVNVTSALGDAKEAVKELQKEQLKGSYGSFEEYAANAAGVGKKANNEKLNAISSATTSIQYTSQGLLNGYAYSNDLTNQLNFTEDDATREKLIEKYNNDIDIINLIQSLLTKEYNSIEDVTEALALVNDALSKTDNSYLKSNLEVLLQQLDDVAKEVSTEDLKANGLEWARMIEAYGKFNYDEITKAFTDEQLAGFNAVLAAFANNVPASLIEEIGQETITAISEAYTKGIKTDKKGAVTEATKDAIVDFINSDGIKNLSRDAQADLVKLIFGVGYTGNLEDGKYILSGFTYGVEDAIAKAIQGTSFLRAGNAAKEGLQKALNENLDKLSVDDVKKVSSAIDSVDWTQDGALDALGIKLEEIGIKLNLDTQAWRDYAAAMAAAGNRTKDVTTFRADVNQRLGAFDKVKDDGSSISDEDYQVLLDANATVADFFLVTADGYALIGDKEDLGKLIFGSIEDDAKNSIEALNKVKETSDNVGLDYKDLFALYDNSDAGVLGALNNLTYSGSTGTDAIDAVLGSIGLSKDAYEDAIHYVQDAQNRLGLGTVTEEELSQDSTYQQAIANLQDVKSKLDSVFANGVDSDINDYNSILGSTAKTTAQLDKALGKTSKTSKGYTDNLKRLGKQYASCKDELDIYNDAVKTLGPNSLKAKKAQKDLTDAIRKSEWEEASVKISEFTGKLNNADTLATMSADDIAAAYQKIASELSSLSGLDISSEFVQNNMDIINAWLDGVEGAGSLLAVNMATSTEGIISEINSFAGSTTASVDSFIEDLNGKSFTVDGQADFSDIINQMIEMKATGDDAASVLSGIGMTDLSILLDGMTLPAFEGDLSTEEGVNSFVAWFNGLSGTKIQGQATGTVPASKNPAVTSAGSGGKKGGGGGGKAKEPTKFDKVGAAVSNAKNKYEDLEKTFNRADSHDDRIAALQAMADGAIELGKKYSEAKLKYKEWYEEIAKDLPEWAKTLIEGGQDIDLSAKAYIELDEETQKKIQKAQEQWNNYEEMEEGEEEAAETLEQIWEDTLNEIKSMYDDLIGEMENEADALQDEIKLQLTVGLFVDGSAYFSLIDNARNLLGIYEDELSDLYDMMDGANEDLTRELNEAIREIESSMRDLTLSIAEYVETLKEIPTNIFSNLLQMVADNATDISNAIAEAEAHGLKATESLYRALIANAAEANTQLQKEHKFLEDMLKTYEVGSDKYYDTLTLLQAVDDLLSLNVLNTYKWQEAILSIPLDYLEDMRNEISKQKNVIETLMSDWDEIIEAVGEAYDAEIDKINEEKDAYEEAMNDKIKLLQDQLDLLNDNNEALDKELSIEQALYDLDKARNQQTVRVIRNGRVTYEADQEKIRLAENAYAQALYNKKVYDLLQEIAALEDERDKQLEAYEDLISALEEQAEVWSTIVDNIEKAGRAAKAADYFGSKDWAVTIVNDEVYSKAQADIMSNQYSVAYDLLLALEEQENVLEVLRTDVEDWIEEWQKGKVDFDDAVVLMNNALADFKKQTGIDLKNEINGNDKYVSKITSYTDKLVQVSEKIYKQLDDAISNAKKATEVKTTSRSSGGSSGGGGSSNKGYVTAFYDAPNGNIIGYGVPGTSGTYSSAMEASQATGMPIRVDWARAQGIETGAIGNATSDLVERLRWLSTRRYGRDEVPILAHAGEVVLNKEQQANLLNNVYAMQAFGLSNMPRFRGAGIENSQIISITMGNLTLPQVRDGNDFADFIANNLETAVGQRINHK